MALPLDGANKGKNGSSFGRFNRKHWKVVTAIIVAIVLVVLAIASSIASLIMMITSDDDGEGASTTTYLYVQLMKGSKDSPGKGIEGANVVLKQQIKDNPAEYTLGPTDKDGIAFMVLPTAGAANFTAPCPSEYKPDSKGRPTVNYCKVIKRGATIYSQQRPHGSGSSFHGGYGKGFGWARLSAKSDHLSSQEGKPAPSDTWHIGAIQMPVSDSSGNSDGLYYHELTYVSQAQGYDYGTTLIEDCGSGLAGNHAVMDIYEPYTKYYGWHGSSNYGDSMASLTPWLKAMGLSGVDFGNGQVYVLGNSKDESIKAGKKIRSQITANGGQNWPGLTPAVPGSMGVGNSGKKGESKENTDAYKVVYQKSETNSASSDLSWQAMASGTKESPYIVSGSGYFYKFWTVTVTNGTGLTGQDIAGLNSESELQSKPEANENHGTGRAKYHGISTYNHDTLSVYTGSSLPNCTSWVNLRAYETSGKQVTHRIYDRPSSKVKSVSDLQVGDFLMYGNSHVAFVEAINGDSVTISESGKTYYSQNKSAGLNHPWYQVLVLQGVSGLKAHHSGTLSVVHKADF